MTMATAQVGQKRAWRMKEERQLRAMLEYKIVTREGVQCILALRGQSLDVLCRPHCGREIFDSGIGNEDALRISQSACYFAISTYAG